MERISINEVQDIYELITGTSCEEDVALEIIDIYEAQGRAISEVIEDYASWE